MLISVLRMCDLSYSFHNSEHYAGDQELVCYRDAGEAGATLPTAFATATYKQHPAG
jgi:hypothetical protein